MFANVRMEVFQTFTAGANHGNLALPRHSSFINGHAAPDSKDPSNEYKHLRKQLPALFAGNEVGAENWAMLASLVATCKMADVNPVDYLAVTLRAILDGHLQSRIEELMPWHFNQMSTLAA